MIEMDPFSGPFSMEHMYQEPFVIRSHHLALIRYVMQGQSPQQVSDTLYLISRGDTDHEGTYDNTYAVDVYGIASDDKHAVSKNRVEFLESFLNLPVDHPVKLSVKEKDTVCTGCVIGEHCDKTVADEDSRDVLYHNSFIAAAKKLGIADEIMVSTEPQELTNGSTEENPVIYTTAGVVNKILEDKKFDKILNNPDAYLAKNTDILHKLYPMRSIAGILAGLAAVGAVYNMGEAVQSMQNSEQVKSLHVKNVIANESFDDFVDATKSIGIMSISGLVYIALPRRRKHRE